MPPFIQLQWEKANCRITRLTPLPTSRELWQTPEPSTMPFCFWRRGKWKWEAVPGEKLERSRGLWLPRGSLPAWAASTASSVSWSMFYQAGNKPCPTLLANICARRQCRGHGAEPVLQRSLLSYLLRPPQGKTKHSRKGKPAKRGI